MKDMELYNPTIWFTCMTWHEISTKLSAENVNKFTFLFEEKMNLSNYGKGVEKFIFIFIAMLPDDTMHEEETKYIIEEKKLLIYRKLPYEKVVNYTQEEVLRLMAETYLCAMFGLGTFNVPDFDYLALARDSQQLLTDVGWVTSEHEDPIRRNIKTETVSAFLQWKGWLTKNISPRYRVMCPPSSQNNLKYMQLYLPLFLNGNTAKYENAWTHIINLIAKTYQIDRLELELLFSKDKQQIGKDIERLQGVMSQT